MTRRLPLLLLLLAAPVRVEDFARFRWIEGTWRGTGEGVDAFFERYR
jgi:hypothetical protein